MRWGFVFVACPLPLSEEQRLELVRLAALAWFQDLPEIRFDWEGCEGVVRIGSEVMSLGAFTGQLFIALVNIQEESGGKSGEVRFLVAEGQLSRQSAEA
jgi:hypothetical protein